MASIDGIPLRRGSGGTVAGAAFELDKEAGRSFELATDYGTGRLEAGAATCVVELDHQLGRQELLEVALDLASQTLDVDGFMDGRFRSMPDCYTDHVLWWHEENGARLLLRSSAHMSVHASVTATKTRADGSQETIETTPPEWTRAMRFLRFSQTTRDLFASYRYLFLAIEAALSEKRPKKPGEGEHNWFLRCNEQLEAGGVDFTSFDGGYSSAVDFTQHQYKSFRCALFHAKAAATSFLPGGATEDRALVAGALGGLGQYVREVFNDSIGTRGYSGGMTLQGIQGMVGGFSSSLTLGVTEDRTPVSEDDAAASPLGLPVTWLPTQSLGPTDGMGFFHGFGGQCEVADLKSTRIRRTVSRADDGLMTAGNVRDLDVAGFETFEQRLDWHHAVRSGGINARFSV
jgi:hypothetical protein